MDPELQHIDTDLIARQAAGAARKRARPWRVATILLLVVLVCVISGLVGQQLAKGERSEKEAAQAQTVGIAQQVLEACRAEDDDPDRAALQDAGVCAAAKRAKDDVEDTRADPQTRYVPIPGPTGSAGAAGRDGTNGRDGTDGDDGQDSTEPGPTGPAGQDSTIPGPTGPQGPAGATGKDGRDGTNGRGVVGVACEGGLTPVTFTFTFSDGTTQTVTCGQLEPVPSPTPTE